MMWWNDGMGWGGWTAMILVMLTFWGLVIFGLVAVFGGTGEGKEKTRTPDLDPQHILRERFARGEIDADEYHTRHDLLKERSRRKRHPR